MTKFEETFAELDRLRALHAARFAPAAPAAATATAGPLPRTVLAFRRRDGRTIKLETPPEARTLGVMRLIKGGQWTSERPIKLPQIPKEPPR